MSECIEALKANLAALPGIETLKFPPQVTTSTAKDLELDEQLKTVSVAPSFMFLDPFGYDGVTAKVIHAILKDWGCDVAFFFCYKRMPGAIMNNKVRSHMDELFGAERVDALRALLPTLPGPAAKEEAILTALEESLNGIGGRYVQTFRFRDSNDNVTHHIVFVTKDPTAHHIMKGIMGNASSSFVDGVPSFEYRHNAPQMLLQTVFPIEALMHDLLEKFRHRTMTIQEIFDAHHYGTPFVEKNYQEALRRLFYDRKAISAVRGEMKPPLNPAKRSMPFENTIITFDKV